MASVCISSCVDDARVPVRATYMNLYKWPESDFEFVRSMSSRAHRGPHGQGPRVVDSISCRQLYLRSYTFSREEDYRENRKTLKCLSRRAVDKREIDKESRKRKCGASGLTRRAKTVSSAAMAAVFRRLLSCTAEVKVVN